MTIIDVQKDLQASAYQRLNAAALRKILVLDGAMGTLIQRHKLDEAGFRGQRFADWHTEVRGNSDLLVLTQPEIIRSIHDLKVHLTELGVPVDQIGLDALADNLMLRLDNIGEAS